MKKGDIILICLLFVFAIALSGITVTKKTNFNRVQIIQDGAVIEEYLMDSNFEKTINIKKQHFQNQIRIENGEVKMVSANCPDQLCVKSHPIHKNGEMIVCLPHRLYVKLNNSQNEEVDSIAR